MSYFFERNIAEVQREYSKFLTDILSPLLYEGIKSIYDDSKSIHDELMAKCRRDPSVKPLSLIQVFQSRLKEIPELNSSIIEGEANRIKSSSRCYDWFDDLVRATVKSKILMLSFANGKTDKSKPSLDRSHYERVDVNDFIHKCYIECSKLFYNNPYLFVDNIKTYEIKKNQLLIIESIKDCIKSAIVRCLPMNLVLKDFIETEVFEFIEDIPQSRFNSIRDRVDKDVFEGAQNEFEEIDEDDGNEMEYSQYDNEIKDRLGKLKDDIQAGGKTQKDENSFSENGSEEHNDSESSRNSDDSENSKNSKSEKEDRSIEKLNNEIDNNIINEPIKVGAGNRLTLLDIAIEGKDEGKDKSVPLNKHVDEQSQMVGQVVDQNDKLDKLKFFAKYLD